MRTLLIDADDTLWESNIYYMRCSEELTLWLISLGIERSAIEKAIARFEQEVLPEFGYSPHGYIEALALATQHLAQVFGLEVTSELLEKARSFGAAMIHPPMVLLPQVDETLSALAPQNRLILVTKGDRVLQQRKLERSGLASYFDRVHVLVEKDADGYRELVQQEGLDPANTWMIGNSPKSDINPAIEAGLHAIYIPYEYTWSAECVEITPSSRVATLPRFADLVDHFNHESP
jgi:putative hydrolase of the HAD superfamily